MAIAIALLGFNDLGRSVISSFLFRNRFLFTIIFILFKNEQNSMREVKKIHDFCPRDIESCHHAAARRVKLWSLNANLVF